MDEDTVYVARNANKKLLVNWLATVNDVVESEIGAVVHGRLDDDKQLNYLMFTGVRQHRASDCTQSKPFANAEYSEN